MYSGRLSLVGDLLQGLFKEAYSLQKGLMEVLEKIKLDDSSSEEEVSDIVIGVWFCGIYPALRCQWCNETANSKNVTFSSLSTCLQ